MKEKLLLIFVCLSGMNMHAKQIIDLSKLGVEKHVSDMTPFIYDILKRPGNQQNIKLVIPKGTYHFYPEEAYGKYHAITNHDNGFRRFAFPLVGYKDIEIEGNGSEFIFHGQMIPFLVEESENISISGVNIDWEVPFYLEGTVMANDQANSYIDVEISPGFNNFVLQGKRMIIRGEGWEEYLLGENICFNPATKAVQYRTDDWHYIPKPWSGEVQVEQLSERLYRMHSKFVRQVPPPGTIITFKGTFGSNRHSPAFHLTDAKNISLQNINIYHAGGMGVIAEKTENVYLKAIQVRLRPGSRRILSTTADATHFCNCKGTVRIEDCLFENMLDDACNMHGTYTKIEKIIDRYSVVARLSHPQQFGFRFASAGDTVQYVSGDKLLPLGNNIIKSVEVINDKFFRFVFEEPIDSHIKAGDGLENIEWYPVFYFKNNIVRNNRARSILVSSPKKVLIEGNTFSSQMTSVLIEGDMDHWFESGAVKDVVIRNNRFLDCAYGGGAPHVIIWINPHLEVVDPDQPFEKNILIENNLFQTFGDGLVRAHSVDNLQFINNTIEESDAYEKWKEEPVIEVNASKNVVIEGNKNKRTKAFEVKADKTTREYSPQLK